MNVTISAKKMQVGQSFTDYAKSRLSNKLDRFFGEEADAKITLRPEQNNVTLELTVKYDNLIYRSEQTAADKNDALDACIDKIIRAIRKHKTRVEKRLRENAFMDAYVDEVEEQSVYQVVKHKQFVLRPMSTDEAILQMNMLGHTFFMFKNAETGETNVVYRRKDGDYAVLEPVKD
jgi:putative sigma-54 modulation protein